MWNIRVSVFAIAAALVATPALASEINGTGEFLDINARSYCVYSGLNDNIPDPRDPGGRVQNYGQLVGIFDIYDPSDFDPNADHFQPIPGYACNPNRYIDLHE